MMGEEDDEAQLAALDALSAQMGRGRIMDALPAEEQEAIRIIISPGGGVTIEGGGDTESAEDEAMRAEEVATGMEAMPPATSTARPRPGRADAGAGGRRRGRPDDDAAVSDGL